MKNRSLNCRKPFEFPTRVKENTVLTSGGYPISCGGETNYDYVIVNSCYKYDPYFDTWSYHARLDANRKAMSGIQLNEFDFWLVGE